MVRNKQERILTFQPSKKSKIGLRNIGFLDSRNDSIKPGMNFSKLMNYLIETYITEKNETALIAYYKSRAGELYREKENYDKKTDEQIKKYAEAIEKLKNIDKILKNEN